MFSTKQIVGANIHDRHLLEITGVLIFTLLSSYYSITIFVTDIKKYIFYDFNVIVRLVYFIKVN